jgi:hypothetical protein
MKVISSRGRKKERKKRWVGNIVREKMTETPDESKLEGRRHSSGKDREDHSNR